VEILLPGGGSRDNDCFRYLGGECWRTLAWRCRDQSRNNGGLVMAVYFVQPAGAPVEPIKIGFTEGLERRVIELERQHSCKIAVLAVSTGGRRLERALHEIFAHYRVSGEWFEPADDILRLIDDIRRNGADALPQIDEVKVLPVGVRSDLLREEAAEIVRVLGGIDGCAKEQNQRAAEKTGLSFTQIERLRWKKCRIYADVMDTIRIALANEVDAVTSADLFALKRYVAQLRRTTPTNRLVRSAA
jgi:uncharacterized protein YlaN (UPF0358 family)